MAYDEILANRIRESLIQRANVEQVEEKNMMGGLAFMYKGKMCVGVIKEEMMCRIGTEVYEIAIEKQGCREMDFTGKPIPGYVMVDESGMQTKDDIDYWIQLSLDFNVHAKAAIKKRKKGK